MIFDKKVAAALHIEAAIYLYFQGNYACVATLCGAAEGALPQPQKDYVFAEAKRKLFGQLQSPERDIVSVMNRERDWLKHYNADQPQHIVITDPVAKFWIYRAMSKYFALYGKDALTAPMKEFWRKVAASPNDFQAGTSGVHSD
ncbi:hypothetical protein [Azospirillum sp.]|uniref:hypothetical protein n=1 Tax=Azospirillum sp. TaxID=34012 RepID=UPI003D73E48F